MTGRDRDAPGSRRGRRVWLACWALAVAAACFAGWSGWSWWNTSHSESLALAVARDEARQAARRQIATLHTVDHEHVDAGLQRWLDSTTGLLHDQLRRTRAKSRRKIEQSEVSTRGTVTSAAVTALNRRAGTAQVIATVRIRVAPAGGTPSTERSRYRATLNRSNTGWKLSSLTAVPAGAG